MSHLWKRKLIFKKLPLQGILVSSLEGKPMFYAYDIEWYYIYCWSVLSTNLQTRYKPPVANKSYFNTLCVFVFCWLVCWDIQVWSTAVFACCIKLSWRDPDAWFGDNLGRVLPSRGSNEKIEGRYKFQTWHFRMCLKVLINHPMLQWNHMFGWIYRYFKVQFYPIPSMHGNQFAYIYHKNQPWKIYRSSHGMVGNGTFRRFGNGTRLTWPNSREEQLLFSARRRARSALEKNSATELKICSEAPRWLLVAGWYHNFSVCFFFRWWILFIPYKMAL